MGNECVNTLHVMRLHIRKICDKMPPLVIEPATSNPLSQTARPLRNLQNAQKRAPPPPPQFYALKTK